MTEFDAELYLRLAAERTLLDAPGDDGHAADSPLDIAGHALVAVRAISAGAAQSVVDDYYLALAYRRGEHPHRHLRALRSAARRSQPPPQPGHAAGGAVPAAHRAAVGPVVAPVPGLRSGSTSLHVEMRAAAAPPGPASLIGRAGFASAVSRTRVGRSGPVPGGRVSGPGFPQQLSLTDDRGTTVSASLSGGGSDSQWDGEFEASPGLAEETAWIEVLGERVELPSCAFLARRDLGRAAGRPGSCPGLPVGQGRGHDRVPFDLQRRESSIEALVAAGSLAPGTRPWRRCGTWRPSSPAGGPRPCGGATRARFPSRGGPCWPGAAMPEAPRGSWWRA